MPPNYPGYGRRNPLSSEFMPGIGGFGDAREPLEDPNAPTEHPGFFASFFGRDKTNPNVRNRMKIGQALLNLGTGIASRRAFEPWGAAASRGVGMAANSMSEFDRDYRSSQYDAWLQRKSESLSGEDPGLSDFYMAISQAPPDVQAPMLTEAFSRERMASEGQADRDASDARTQDEIDARAALQTEELGYRTKSSRLDRKGQETRNLRDNKTRKDVAYIRAAASAAASGGGLTEKQATDAREISIARERFMNWSQTQDPAKVRKVISHSDPTMMEKLVSNDDKFYAKLYRSANRKWVTESSESMQKWDEMSIGVQRYNLDNVREVPEDSGDYDVGRPYYRPGTKEVRIWAGDDTWLTEAEANERGWPGQWQ